MQNGTSAATDKNLSQVIKIDQAQIQQHLDTMVRESVQETLNGMLDAEADQVATDWVRTRGQTRPPSRS